MQTLLDAAHHNILVQYWVGTMAQQRGFPFVAARFALFVHGKWRSLFDFDLHTQGQLEEQHHEVASILNAWKSCQ
jgi:hypothetical protein